MFLRGNKQEMAIHQSVITRIDLRETVLDFPNQVGSGDGDILHFLLLAWCDVCVRGALSERMTCAVPTGGVFSPSPCPSRH